MPPLGIDDEGRLDEGTLRRFVFQIFGFARRTQDGPIMPDVWLKYIRLAERIARHTIADMPPPGDAVDLLLTPSGVSAGRIVVSPRLAAVSPLTKAATTAATPKTIIAT